MNNTDNKDFLLRVLSINLHDYLRDLGFNRMDIGSEAAAYNSKFFQDILIVEHEKNNRWISYRSRSESGSKSIIDFGTAFFKCTPLEFLDRVKDAPQLPSTYDQATYLMERRELVIPLSYRQAMHSEVGVEGMCSLMLPEEFIHKHCEEFQFRMGADQTVFTGVQLKSQRDHNHLFKIEKIESGEPNVLLLKLQESFGHYQYHFIDRATPSIDVFASISDLMVKQYQYERLGMQPPSQMLLSGIASFDRARDQMEAHQQINLYLPNAPHTNLYKDYASWLSPKYRDFSKTYGQEVSLAVAHATQERNGQLQRKRPGQSL